jgi:hypothetical protein
MSDELEWKFSDPKNLAVFVDKKILAHGDWICYVSHDHDDGSWQFHGPDGFAAAEDLSVVGLGTMALKDPSVLDLADLPLGWCAWRESPEEAWRRAPKEPHSD